MKQTLKDVKVVYDDPIPILCDNTSAINIYKNLVMPSRTKNISIWCHFLREKVAEQEVRLEYVSIEDQIADIFTKELSKDTFLGVIVPPFSNYMHNWCIYLGNPSHLLS